MDTLEGQSLADKYGDPVPFNDPGPDVAKSEGWKVDYLKWLLLFPPWALPLCP